MGMSVVVTIMLALFAMIQPTLAYAAGAAPGLPIPGWLGTIIVLAVIVVIYLWWRRRS